mgnify:CR=1 FL=1
MWCGRVIVYTNHAWALLVVAVPTKNKESSFQASVAQTFLSVRFEAIVKDYTGT